MTDENDKLAQDHRAPLLEFLWESYISTIDGRTRRGDVETLAEAAERNDWAGSPEIGATIAELLRKAYCEDVKSCRTYTMLRDREILALREDLGWSHAAIADIYEMERSAVAQVISRQRKKRKRKRAI